MMQLDLEHGEASPVSSERLLTPVVLNSSCEPCRQSKVKCSGDPVCSRCASKGYPCVYNPRKKRGKAKELCGYTKCGPKCENDAVGTMNEVVSFCIINNFPPVFIVNLQKANVTSFQMAAEITEDELFQKIGPLSFDQLLMWRAQLKKEREFAATSSQSTVNSNNNCPSTNNNGYLNTEYLTPLVNPQQPSQLEEPQSPMKDLKEVKFEENQCAQFLSNLQSLNLNNNNNNLNAMNSQQCYPNNLFGYNVIGQAQANQTAGLYNNTGLLPQMFNYFCPPVLPQQPQMPQNNNANSSSNCPASMLQNFFSKMCPSSSTNNSSSWGPPSASACSTTAKIEPFTPANEAVKNEEDHNREFWDGLEPEKKCMIRAMYTKLNNCKKRKMMCPKSAMLMGIKQEEEGEGGGAVVKQRMEVTDWLVSLLGRLSKLTLSSTTENKENDSEVQPLEECLKDIVRKIEAMDTKDRLMGLKPSFKLDRNGNNVETLQEETLDLIVDQVEKLRLALKKK